MSGMNEVGKVWRQGRENVSSACGALLALHTSLRSGNIKSDFNPGDVEMSLLTQRVLARVQSCQELSINDLTYTVHECIREQVARTASSTADMDQCEYIIISGIQVHTGFKQNFYWPGTATKHTSAGALDLLPEFLESMPPCFPGRRWQYMPHGESSKECGHAFGFARQPQPTDKSLTAVPAGATVAPAEANAAPAGATVATAPAKVTGVPAEATDVPAEVLEISVKDAADPAKATVVPAFVVPADDSNSRSLPLALASLLPPFLSSFPPRSLSPARPRTRSPTLKQMLQDTKAIYELELINDDEYKDLKEAILVKYKACL